MSNAETYASSVRACPGNFCTSERAMSECPLDRTGLSSQTTENTMAWKCFLEMHILYGLALEGRNTVLLGIPHNSRHSLYMPTEVLSGRTVSYIRQGHRVRACRAYGDKLKSSFAAF